MAIRGGGRVATPPTTLVVIATPKDRRVELLQRAYGARGTSPVPLISYEQVLAGAVDWHNVVPQGAVVRIESPGKSATTQAALIRAGGGSAEPLLPGEWRESAAWYRGFCVALERIREGVASIAGVRWMNSPDAIALMFDKVACHAHLHHHGIPVAPTLPSIHSYNEVLRAMRQQQMTQVFIKSRYGSSAAGVVAFRVQGEQQLAVTTVELSEESGQVRLFNTRQLRRYTHPETIATLIDALCRDGVQVERWIPKAGWQGKTFDLRMVVIGGKVRHQVMRLSNTPMTNLHLLNQRSDTTALAAHVGANAWARVLECCEATMATFPDALYAGIDIALSARTYQPVVLEVNAFGDLLPGILSEGEDTYTAELAQCGWG